MPASQSPAHAINVISTLPFRLALLSAILLALAGCGPRVDIHYIPTPEPVVEAMLEMAEIEEGDVLYDLGSGDGRIPITAAKRFGVRAVGIEIDPQLIRIARRNAEEAGVSHLVEFRESDLFETDFSDADVVTLYLGDMLNLRLRPRLLEQLEPGARVVSHDFNMGDWTPEERRVVANRPVYKWTVPQTFIPGFGGVD
ncbi:class I SAM-dependent methyltransferase [Pelagerythrobacter rhizovicinus]|uniref:Class I SAM-dependent methyltransferase n=1 Tax=Pelagerythrobacter rhizovicinus TaxID=2268576 RepID=A0A4Q2KQ32_9SPHN|nr:class I SAM-dependent methyltransferase [Pelagerythrobacter rhizovicinus]